MRVGVIGVGVTGTIYGCVLAEAGHDVLHYVRPGSVAALHDGTQVNLLDARGGEAKVRRLRYQPEVRSPVRTARAPARSLRR